MSRYRLVYTGLGLLLVAILAVAFAFYPEGEHSPLPDPLEAVFPNPGDAVVRQTVIQVDMPVGYGLDLIVDGVRIPDQEVGFTQATGVFTWQPTPGGTMEIWTAGRHTVRIDWDRLAGGRPDPGTFTWSFTVQ